MSDMAGLPNNIRALMDEHENLTERIAEIDAEVLAWRDERDAELRDLGILRTPIDTTQYEAVIARVVGAGVPMRTIEVAQGMGFQASNVRAHLARAVVEGALGRVRRSVYAAPDEEGEGDE